VQGQTHNEFAQSKIDITLNELREERECVKDLLG
jgi:malate dehydrogenase